VVGESNVSGDVEMRSDGQDVSNLRHQTFLMTYQLEYNSKDEYRIFQESSSLKGIMVEP
jgi:hypothetical protein